MPGKATMELSTDVKQKSSASSCKLSRNQNVKRKSKSHSGYSHSTTGRNKGATNVAQPLDLSALSDLSAVVFMNFSLADAMVKAA